MSHQHNSHDHNHSSNVSRTRLKIVLVIILVIMLAEVAGGVLSNSLALIGDAGHMLVDALALALSLFAITMAAKPATSSKTFGYHRVEIMAALANGILLALVAAYIFYEAFQRFTEPPEIQAPLMMVVAGIGLVANIIGILLLSGVSSHNLNMKAAFWHILGDTVSSVGVIIAGVIIWTTGFTLADPIIAVIIGCIILFGGIRLVKASVDILLEAAPSHIAVEEVAGVMQSVEGVDEIHDIHIWTLTSHVHALSAHLLIHDQSVSGSADIVDRVNYLLADKFNITHTTLQLECERCASCPDGMVCNIIRPATQAHQH